MALADSVAAEQHKQEVNGSERVLPIKHPAFTHEPNGNEVGEEEEDKQLAAGTRKSANEGG